MQKDNFCIRDQYDTDWKNTYLEHFDISDRNWALIKDLFKIACQRKKMELEIGFFFKFT